MKILELRAENVKNLKVVEIKPGDGSVVLTGKNGAGKSAVLDSIFMALTGKKLEQPIREGEDRAEVNVDLGDYRVKKVFTAKGERLEVISKEGAVYKSPQALLNGILGNLTFDPLQFSTMQEKPRRDLLASLVGLDFSELDKTHQGLYNERTMKHREIKGVVPVAAQRGSEQPLPVEQLAFGMEQPPEGTPREEISLSDEFAKVEALEAKAREYQRYEREYDEMMSYAAKCLQDIAGKNEEISQLEERIKALQHDVDVLTNNHGKALADAALLSRPEPVTSEQLAAAREAVKQVESKNILIRGAVEYDRRLAAFNALKKDIVLLERQMSDIDNEKQKAITAAVFPIEGLALMDECVTYQGTPFGQLSTGEQIRISTAVAMALNPTLRIILVREGSLLDKDGLAAVIALAKEKDYQLWLERVADDKGVGIYLEAGEVK